MDRFEGVAVVGGGVAGLVAAMYVARQGAGAMVFEGDPFDFNDLPGGQLMTAEHVEFVPGFPDGVEGPILMAGLRTQVEELGAEIVAERVTAVEPGEDGWVVSSTEREVCCSAVVAASGARPRLLDVGEEKYLGSGVSLCAVCDAPLFKGRQVAVVGGGDTAAEEALILARYASSVTIVHRGPELDAHLALRKRIDAASTIDVRLGTVVTGVGGNDAVDRLRYLDTTNGNEAELAVEGIFVAAGRLPNTEMFAAHVTRDERGYIETDQRSMTSAAGLFACGECQDPDYRQYSSAVGSGCRAGLEAARFLRRSGQGATQMSSTEKSM